MSTDRFTITEHIPPGCHIREYPGSTVNQEDVLQLHIKQYTPKDQPQPVPADAITFIAAHGTALPKELYEPLWDELLDHSTRHGFKIRGIWVADCASMNSSGILNEDRLSMDCSWMDHSRDLFLLINHFREQMPRPLIGIGHSFGGNIITNLAYLHPRLFTTLLLLDPVIQLTPPPMGFGTDALSPINYTLWRDDVWPNREAALHANRRMLHGWDPRCARLGTSSDSSIPVTLTTTKYHDLLGQIRENFGARDPASETLRPRPCVRDPASGSIRIPRATHADLDPLAAFIPMYRPEPRSVFLRLETLRPSCLWVLGGATYLSLDEMREGIKVCGTGVTLPGLGHLMPFQEVRAVMEPCGRWIGEEMEKYRGVEREWEEKRRGRSHQVLEEQWYKTLRPLGGGQAKKARKEKI
ncbi:putative hydrolase [Aspergillus steynii IBT 23096]|uniref:Putative hydrolase n=1 Tax=Aspergillus steynii IBT 23096 TaxID=1392250 RepID=A0A2I2G626_9EURO|nr:putative hydrolase [Aspergillus steynii IBT 23096]PLB48303.1 putative hydrolase [Aspergillus steynii IBT 23096]